MVGRIFFHVPYLSLVSAFVMTRPSIYHSLIPPSSWSSGLQVVHPANEESSPSQTAASLLEHLIASPSTTVETGRHDEELLSDAALPGIDLGDISDPKLAHLLNSLHNEKGAISSFATRADNFTYGSREFLPPPSATGCQLISFDNNSLILSENEMNPFLVSLFQDAFQAVVDSFAQYGYHTELSPFDLFHGHLFATSTRIPHATKALGILFHCYEYPAADSIQILPNVTSLGYCQVNSTCYPKLQEWRYRNVLGLAWWLKETPWSQAMWLLDGNSSIVEILRVDASSFGPNCPNTVWEGWFGKTIGDLYNVSDHLIWIESC